MIDLIFRPSALADLKQIWHFTQTTWNETQAESYVRLLLTAATTLVTAPGIAQPCDEIKPGFWKYRAGSHILFFRRTENKIIIVRILHKKMDFERYL